MPSNQLVGIRRDRSPSEANAWITPPGSTKSISGDHILLICQKICQDLDLACEIAGEISIKLIQGTSYDDSLPLPPYVAGMAQRLFLSTKRKARRHGEVSLAEMDPIQPIPNLPADEFIQRQIADLNEQDLDFEGFDERSKAAAIQLMQEDAQTREIIKLRFVHKYSHDEIAARLNMAAPAVGKRVSRYYSRVLNAAGP